MFVVIKGNQSKEVKIIDIYNSNSWRHSGEAETVCVVPVIVGALGMFSNGFEKHLDKLEAKMRLQVIQKSALFGMARILRKLSSVFMRHGSWSWLEPLATCCRLLPSKTSQILISNLLFQYWT